MTIVNVGSINWDRIYRVPHFPAPGETLSARSAAVGLGGKGLNQSVAILRSGGRVVHLGAIGGDDVAMLDALGKLGLDLSALERLAGVETGSALILVDDAGENLIVLDPGANRRMTVPNIDRVISGLSAGDWLLMQNETNGNPAAISAARRRGVKVALAAAPFEAAAVLPLLADLDLLSVNEIEHAQLTEAMGATGLPSGLALLISMGARGARYLAPGIDLHVPAFKVTPVDTTGAGDTALGAFMARIDLGETVADALRFAMAAAAIQITRPGAVPAIPVEAEVREFLTRHN